MNVDCILFHCLFKGQKGEKDGYIDTVSYLGLTLIFGVLKVVNFAHGEFYTAGVFINYVILEQLDISSVLGVNIFIAYFISFILSVIIVGVIGYFVEMTIFSRFHGDLISGLIVSVGLSMVLQVIYVILFGSSAKDISSVFEGTTNILGGTIANERIAIFVMALLLTVCLYLIVMKTKFGRAMRAISQDKEAAELQGINYKLVSRYGFVLGVVLAALAGVMVSPASIAEPFIGEGYLLKAFIIIILGGMGSIPGCILAGFILGFIESFGSFYFDLHFATILSFVLVMIMLLIRPQGLMGNVSK
jgi:branched-chain amino acid transport system permease protein